MNRIHNRKFTIKIERLSAKHCNDMQNMIRDEIFRYATLFSKEKEKIATLSNFLSKNKHALSRKNRAGHITASGIVVYKKKILFIRHPVLKTWLQPGGHIDENELPSDAAIREVAEETGVITKIHDWHAENRFPVDIDIYTIPENILKNEPEHIHYDFRYFLEEKNKLPTHELDFKWLPGSRQFNTGIQRIFKKIDLLSIKK